MATVFQCSEKYSEKYSEKHSEKHKVLRRTLHRTEKYSEKHSEKHKVLRRTLHRTENILPKNMNSEIIQNSQNTVQAAPIFHSEKAHPATQACSPDLFLKEISRAPFRGNKWLSSLELAARRAKLIGKTHVRTPQVRRLLPKRELVRKGSEKTAKSACPRRHAAPTP